LVKNAAAGREHQGVAKEKVRILSLTLAEIYMQQGHFDKAREIYERLLSKDGENLFYRRRLALLSAETPDVKRLRALSRLLRKIEERRDDREAVR
jgi:pentatricopeptide repeat protein